MYMVSCIKRIKEINWTSPEEMEGKHDRRRQKKKKKKKKKIYLFHNTKEGMNKKQ